MFSSTYGGSSDQHCVLFSIHPAGEKRSSLLVQMDPKNGWCITVQDYSVGLGSILLVWQTFFASTCGCLPFCAPMGVCSYSWEEENNLLHLIVHLMCMIFLPILHHFFLADHDLERLAVETEGKFHFPMVLSVVLF